MGTLLATVSIAAILLAACSTNTPKKETESTTSTTAVKEDKSTSMLYKETKGKDVTYYTMKPDAQFQSTATIIEKDGKGLLVDTQFSKKDAEKIVAFAKDKKIDIETVYISYSDPDYYFGTEQITKAFPKAKVVATAETIKRIEDTYEEKLEFWADDLKDNAPDEIIIPEEIKDFVKIGDTSFTIFGKDTKKQTLYNAEDDLLLGGILVSAGGHLFMADTKTVESQEQWVKDLEEIDALKAKVVIPGHFEEGNDFSNKNITFTKDYINKFIEVEKTSDTTAEIMDKMKKAYPELPEGSLEMSAQVVSGEMAWD